MQLGAIKACDRRAAAELFTCRAHDLLGQPVQWPARGKRQHLDLTGALEEIEPLEGLRYRGAYRKHAMIAHHENRLVSQCACQTLTFGSVEGKAVILDVGNILMETDRA